MSDQTPKPGNKWQELIDAIMKVKQQEKDWILDAKRHRKAAEKTIACPICSSELRICVASNSHTAGQCKTENCLSWIE